MRHACRFGMLHVLSPWCALEQPGKRGAVDVQGHARLPDATLRLWPVLDAARRHIPVERVCAEGQLLCIPLRRRSLLACADRSAPAPTLLMFRMLV